jgi:hypothetical protein
MLTRPPNALLLHAQQLSSTTAVLLLSRFVQHWPACSPTNPLKHIMIMTQNMMLHANGTYTKMPARTMLHLSQAAWSILH